MTKIVPHICPSLFIKGKRSLHRDREKDYLCMQRLGPRTCYLTAPQNYGSKQLRISQVIALNSQNYKEALESMAKLSYKQPNI